MTTIFVLLVLAAVIGGIFWKMQKSKAEEEAARQRMMRHKRKQAQQAITPEKNATWPVIVKPVKGDGAAADDDALPEPTMTAVAFEPDEELKTSA